MIGSDMAHVLGILDNFYHSLDKEDCRRWMLKANGDFSLKSCYRLFDRRMVDPFSWTCLEK